jgi:hypothetical protein
MIPGVTGRSKCYNIRKYCPRDSSFETTLILLTHAVFHPRSYQANIFTNLKVSLVEECAAFFALSTNTRLIRYHVSNEVDDIDIINSVGTSCAEDMNAG